MFDIGWHEVFLIALITIIVVGPKELPGVLRTVTLWIRKVRMMAREFQDGMEDLARESELDDLRREIEDSATGDLEEHIEKTIDPSGEMGDSVREIGGALEKDPITAEPADEARPKPQTAAAKPAKPDKPAETEAPAPNDIPAPKEKEKAGGAG